MDCCNYMQPQPHHHQQHHRQPYYAAHYYEGAAATAAAAAAAAAVAMPPYGHDYHPHHYAMGAHHYNGPTWAFAAAAAACTDYVYNPKEARIKKALRERERSMGGAQMGAQRQRRSPHWPKNNVHVPATQNNPVPMAGPPKDHHGVMRPGPDQGFMGGNGAYMYAAQNYPFSSPTDYQFVNQTSHWTTNTYMPNQSQVEQYNQFESERHRMQTMMQPNPGTSYMLPQSSQATSYHNIEHVPMMAPAQKPTMLDNLDSSSIDDRFLSLRDNLDEHPDSVPSGALGINTSVADSIPSVEQTSNDLSRAHSLPNVTNNVTETLTSSALHTDDATVTGISSAASDLANISNMPVEMAGKEMLPNVDTVYHQLSNVVDKSDNTFSGIQLFEDDSLANITTTPLTKSHLQSSVSERKNSNSLPDFNEAFGSTERGRFQSPPDPRIALEKDYLNYFNANFLVRTEQNNKWNDLPDSFLPANFNVSF